MAELDSLDALRRQLLDAGAIRDPAATLTPLTGGVSSDIHRVVDGDRVLVVKRALPRLKVADEWLADTSRNRFEQAYLEKAGQIVPGAVPRVLSANPDRGWFAMEHLDGFANWKTELLSGHCDPAPARAAARILATIHRATWDDAATRAQFDSTANFHQLRIDPYLLTSAERSRHPDLAAAIRAEAGRLRETRRCLVHGDYSPKNLLIRGDRLVVLDGEVAWFGDPAFDVAFLLNHLLLKALHFAGRASDYAALAIAAWLEYRETLHDPEKIAAVAGPLPALLPMLMLARVDGKSPVEYLTDELKRQAVRAFAVRAVLRRKPADPCDLAFDWWREIVDTFDPS